MKTVPSLGIGIGLRPFHFPEISSQKPPIDWFEIISEHFLEGGRGEELDWILENYPVVMHGVTLSIGSAEPLDFNYLQQLKKLARKTKTPWFSDHLAWGRLAGAHYHDLLSLPFTREVADYVAERARIVQDFIEVPFALENVSGYTQFSQREMNEWEFYVSIAEKADIGLMLDVNNVYVSGRNQGFDPLEFLNHVPFERVVQIHLAGHTDYGTHCLDTHDQPVRNEVWDLYAKIYPKTNKASTLLEWDDHYLSLEETWKEALKAKAFQKELVEN
jgi:uncharacterized protein